MEANPIRNRFTHTLLMLVLAASLAQASNMRLFQEHDVTMAPLTYLAEWLGATVREAPGTQRITLSRPPHTFAVHAAERGALVDGKSQTLPVPAEELDGVLYVPVVPLLTAFGGQAAYNRQSNEITLQMPKGTEKLVLPINAKHYRSTALHLDAYAGVTRLLQLHLAQAEGIDAPESLLQMTPLHFAAFRGSNAVMAILLSHHARINVQSTQGVSPLMMAVMAGKTEIVEMLLHAGANIELRDKGGATPLHAAAKSGQAGTFLCLVKHNAAVRARTESGQTMLHLAVIGDNPTVAMECLRQGLDVNARDDQRWAPLHFAVALNRLNCAAFLLAHGADIHAKQGEGDTPLQMAKKLKLDNMIKLLRAHGA